jgi:GTP-binding protein HflX
VFDGGQPSSGAGGIPGGERKAFLLSPEKDTAEIEALARSAGMRVVRAFVQRMESPNPKYFLGEGKVERIARLSKGGSGDGKAKGKGGTATAGADDVLEDDEGAGAGEPAERPDLAVFNGNLKPTQVFHLEKALGIPVFDRIRLILEIFTKRANSPEARLQVELAHLQYDVPLIKEYIHRTRTGEHPGLFYAGGAYQVDDYYDMIKSRMARIKRELERIGGERAQRRKTRRRGGQALLALAGYTNAGKSALFGELCDEPAAVNDELFTTLSTTTRRLRFPVQGSGVLVTDTVGFIRNLPPWLVEAFMSTLEEVFLSDGIILVVDLSDTTDEMLSKLETTLAILRKGERPIPTVVAFNKADLLEEPEIQRRMGLVLAGHEPGGHCAVSAVSGRGLGALVALALSSLPDFFFGDLAGPPGSLSAFGAEGIHAVEPDGSGRSVARNVLLRNWKIAEMARNDPSLVFERKPG